MNTAICGGDLTHMNVPFDVRVARKLTEGDQLNLVLTCSVAFQHVINVRMLKATARIAVTTPAAATLVPTVEIAWLNDTSKPFIWLTTSFIRVMPFRRKGQKLYGKNDERWGGRTFFFQERAK